jgi:hypothetical protein
MQVQDEDTIARSGVWVDHKVAGVQVPVSDAGFNQLDDEVG